MRFWMVNKYQVGGPVEATQRQTKRIWTGREGECRGSTCGGQTPPWDVGGAPWWWCNNYLYRCKNSGHIVGWTPSVLQDVEADAPVSVHVGMEHFRHEPDRGGFVGVFFREFYCELKGAVLEGRVVRAKDDGVPDHYVVVCGRSRHPRRGVFLQSGNKISRVNKAIKYFKE